MGDVCADKPGPGVPRPGLAGDSYMGLTPCLYVARRGHRG